MNKEFVPYEQALELKELDYDKPCFGWYHDNILEFDFKIRANEIIKHHELLGRFKGSILAPTFSQAFRWFREKHNLFGQVNIHTYFIYDISNDEFKSAKQYDKSTKNYEEAEQACLEKLIELVKNK
jgi:hypothetical protein